VLRVLRAIASISAVALAPSAHADPPAPVPQPILQPLALGQAIRIAPAAGTGTPTSDYDIGATDLCDFMEFPTGILQICGDSFPGQGVGFGRGYSPIALHVDTDSINDPAGVRYDGVTGTDKPLLADPKVPGTSQLPAGIVDINRVNYMLVTTTKDLVPQTSRLVKAIPGQGNWPTVPKSERPADYAGGRQTQISGYYDPIPTSDSQSGWVYVVANNFDRSAPLELYRTKPETFTDRASWQGWSNRPGKEGGWNKPPTPLWDDKIGEVTARQIDGKTVLSYFNASTGNMEVRVADDPTTLGTAPATTVVFAGKWPEPADALPPREDIELAQPYGGYISPGSTLDELRVFVSQWNTTPAGDNAPYRVIQFAVNPFKP
jgi:D-arabinan endo alpha-(1,5)-arabinofuranosidase